MRLGTLRRLAMRALCAVRKLLLILGLITIVIALLALTGALVSAVIGVSAFDANNRSCSLRKTSIRSS